jgi:hypothetical protein
MIPSGGPLLRGAQAILQSRFKEVLFILSNSILSVIPVLDFSGKRSLKSPHRVRGPDGEASGPVWRVLRGRNKPNLLNPPKGVRAAEFNWASLFSCPRTLHIDFEAILLVCASLRLPREMRSLFHWGGSAVNISVYSVSRAKPAGGGQAGGEFSLLSFRIRS